MEADEKRNVYREMLSQKRLSISDKTFIEAEYESTFNRKLNVKSDCRNCYNDALIELYSSKREYKLKAGQVVEIDGKYYNRHTLPQNYTK